MLQKKGLKIWLLRIALVLLCYPFIELVTPLNLAGYASRSSITNNHKKPTLENFFEGSFQESFTKYVNDQIGLFAFFVKLHNQIEYSLFNNIYTGQVVAGKNNYLFEQPYIDSYFGQDYLGSKRIKRFGGIVKQLQDTLAAMDKILVYALATGKAEFYPEYLPYQKKRDSTNNEYIAQEFKRRGINHIAFTPYLLNLKKQHGDLLFPKYGIHWSYYANTFVADSLAQYIAHKTGWKLPSLKITKNNYKYEAEYFDNDIANALNLFVKPQPDSMNYPHFEWVKGLPKKPKKLLLIGDSFGWDLFENMKIGSECFNEMQFWFYNQSVFKRTLKEGRVKESLPRLTRHVNLLEVLNEFDAFVIIANEPNTRYRGWRFPKDALLTLQDSTYVPEKRGNEYLRINAKEKKGWRQDLERLATERNKSFEQMLELYINDSDFKFEPR